MCCVDKALLLQAQAYAEMLYQDRIAFCLVDILPHLTPILSYHAVCCDIPFGSEEPMAHRFMSFPLIVPIGVVLVNGIVVGT